MPRSCERQHGVAKYSARPSPPYPANECCGTVKKGNDGNMYRSVRANNGVCRWVRAKGSRKSAGRRRTRSSRGRKRRTRSRSRTRKRRRSSRRTRSRTRKRGKKRSRSSRRKKRTRTRTGSRKTRKRSKSTRRKKSAFDSFYTRPLNPARAKLIKAIMKHARAWESVTGRGQDMSRSRLNMEPTSELRKFLKRYEGDVDELAERRAENAAYSKAR